MTSQYEFSIKNNGQVLSHPPFEFPSNFRYKGFIMYLQNIALHQIYHDLKKGIYDITTLGMMIEEGKLDNYGKLSVKGMQKGRQEISVYI